MGLSKNKPKIMIVGTLDRVIHESEFIIKGNVIKRTQEIVETEDFIYYLKPLSQGLRGYRNFYKIIIVNYMNYNYELDMILNIIVNFDEKRIVKWRC